MSVEANGKVQMILAADAMNELQTREIEKEEQETNEQGESNDETRALLSLEHNMSNTFKTSSRDIALECYWGTHEFIISKKAASES